MVEALINIIAVYAAGVLFVGLAVAMLYWTDEDIVEKDDTFLYALFWPWYALKIAYRVAGFLVVGAAGAIRRKLMQPRKRKRLEAADAPARAYVAGAWMD